MPGPVVPSRRTEPLLAVTSRLPLLIARTSPSSTGQSALNNQKHDFYTVRDRMTGLVHAYLMGLISTASLQLDGSDVYTYLSPHAPQVAPHV